MIENITLAHWQEWFGMRDIRPGGGNAPALPRATAEEQEYRWREWAATMALEIAKTHPTWAPFAILELAGGLVEFIKHGPSPFTNIGNNASQRDTERPPEGR